MVDTAEAIFFVAPEEEIRAPVRAVSIDETQSPARIAEGYEILA
jgi:hypothetical protein